MQIVKAKVTAKEKSETRAHTLTYNTVIAIANT